MIDVIQKLFSDGFVYLSIYFILFLLTFVESIKKFNRYRYVTASLSIIFLTFFTGFRWETGTDWISYYNLFQDVDVSFGDQFLVQLYSFDFGYVFLNIIVKYFTSSYTILVLIDSFIALSLVYYIIKKYSPNPNVSVFIFYNSFFIAQFMGSNRRIIAIGLVLFAIATVVKKIKYWFFQGMAFLFHKSSLVSLFALFVPKVRFRVKKILIILTISLLMGILQIPFKILEFLSSNLYSFAGLSVFDKLSFYTIESENVVLGNRDPAIMMVLSIIKRCVFLILYLIIINKNKGKLDSQTDYFFNIYVVGFSLYLLLNGSEVIQLASLYFTIIEIVLFGRIWNYASKIDKQIFLPILFIYGFFQLVSSLTAYPELYFPYKTFFNFL